MADVSRDELKKEITAILKNADLGKTSAKKVRQQLEEKLDTDLSDKKKMVDDLVMEYLKNQKKGAAESDEEENGEDEEEEEEEEDSEEDKKKKKAKRAAPKRKKAASDSEEDDDGEEKESDDEYSPKKKTKAAPKKKGRKKAGSDDEEWGKAKKKRGGGGGGGGKGYTKPLTLSKDLAKLVGQEQMARHEVVKKVWAIIKERNLYDPKNKQFAICDDELYKVIGEKRFRIFGMMKHLKDHFS